MREIPTFAVVGHPNKGKSSIVASLALDDTVAISDIPGTTTKNRRFPLMVDGRVIYELVDTPGFQRARKVLAWLQKHEVSADKKHEVVRAFVNLHKDDPKFHDEIQLLEPILDGAGIIYVVDVSKPYSSEYEAEMEILRWCNQPSMALLNPIDEHDFTPEWKRALGHYFKMVRTYNPMTASYKEHITILESMAHLNESWMQSVKESIAVFELFFQQMIQQAATTITHLVYNSVSHIEKISLSNEAMLQESKEKLQNRYKESLRNLEKESHQRIKKIFHHNHLEIEAMPLPFEDVDLFSKKAASLFGLTKKELLLTATTSGAVTGGAIDLVFAGHTAFLGAITGGVLGGVGAYFGFDELSEIKILGKKLGEKKLQIGPMKNKNFPYILLNRSLFYTLLLIEHSHAKRDTLQLSDIKTTQENLLNSDDRSKLENFHKKFRSKKGADNKTLDAYTELIETILNRELKR